MQWKRMCFAELSGYQTKPYSKNQNPVKSRAPIHRPGLLALHLDVRDTSESVCALTQLRLVDRLRPVERVEYTVSLGGIASLLNVSTH